jgi:hypothetical protein
MDPGPMRLLQWMPCAFRAMVGRRRGRGARSGPAGARAPGQSPTTHLRGACAGALLVAICALTLAFAPALEASGSPAADETLVEQKPKLTAEGEAPEGRLGRSVALSSDGSTLVVGAPKDGGGAVYVFSRDGSTWKQQARLTPGEITFGQDACQPSSCPVEECGEEPQAGEETVECAFGSSVALSADGDTALVGDPSETGGPGSAWVFTRSEDGQWARAGSLVGGDTHWEGRFGRSVALTPDGTTALIGDPSSLSERGGAWLFTREGSSWTRGPMLTDEEGSPLAHLGRTVALSGDGSTALVGGPGDAEDTGAVWQFSRSGGAWLQHSKLTSPGGAPRDRFGRSLALSEDGATALIGAPGAEAGRGAAWTFVRSGGGYVQQGAALLPSEAEGEGHFGTSVSLSGDGGEGLIGAPSAEQGIGTVAQLTRAGAGWSRQPEGLAGGEAQGKGSLGKAVAMSGDGTAAAIGAPRDHLGAGAAWIFKKVPPGSVPPPVVSNVRPGRGPTSGGTPVVVEGANFNGASTVQIGTRTVAATARSTTEIVTVTPPGAPGKVHVTVTTPTGTSATSSKDTFLYEGAIVVDPATTPTTSAPPGSGGVQGFASTSAAACRVSLAKKRLAVTRYRRVALRLLRSGAGACSGRVVLSYKVAARGRGHALRTIGAASFSIPPGTSRVVTIRLSRAGQRWLRAHRGRANASVAIARVLPPPVLAQSASVRLSLKKPLTVGTMR